MRTQDSLVAIFFTCATLILARRPKLDGSALSSMTESSPTSLSWKGTGELESQLMAGGVVVATLRWAKGWGTLATGESIEGKWTFKRAGRLTSKITVNAQGSGAVSATFKAAWRGGGVIELPTGRTFRFSPKGFWRSEWILTDASQRRLLTMRPNFAWKRAEASVKVEGGALEIRELPLLAILCWYAVLLVSHDDSDGDGAIIAAMVATGSI